MSEFLDLVYAVRWLLVLAALALAAFFYAEALDRVATERTRRRAVEDRNRVLTTDNTRLRRHNLALQAVVDAQAARLRNQDSRTEAARVIRLPERRGGQS